MTLLENTEHQADLPCRTTDEDALRAKVDEAMNVYDEYVKNQGDGQEQQTNGDNLNPSVEEVKDAEA